MRNSITLLAIISILLLAACATSTPETIELPTAVSAATIPTIAPPATTLPPTRDLSDRGQSTQPEQADQPTAVPAATKPPTPLPTPVDTAVNLTFPNRNALLQVDTQTDVRGLAERNNDDQVWISLISQTGRLLVEIQANAGPFGWETTFTIPPNTTGDATLVAAVRSASGELLAEDTIPVRLIVNPDSADRYIQLNRPAQNDTAVAGNYLYFDGVVYFPTNNAMRIALWANCEEEVARQGYTLGRSNNAFDWSGLVVVPTDFSGPACAVASFGEPGTADYREAAVAVNVLPPDDSAARGVTIGGPAPGSTVTAGSELLVYGTALNAGDSAISIGISLESGRSIGQATVTADYWGYWEATFRLPIDIEEPASAQISVLVGQAGDDNHAGANTLITINPAPTPTP